jgi:membrane fusion protein, multidrug efflux system
MKFSKIIIALFVVALLGGCSGGKKEDRVKMKDIQEKEGIPVRVVDVKPQTMIIAKKYSGALRGQEEANAEATIAGNIDKILVGIGDYVKKDQIVAQFREDVGSSQYRQAKAAFENNKENLERYQKLLATGAISQSTFDGIKTAFDVSKANYEAAEKQVFVKAPIAGVVSEIYYRDGDNVPQNKPVVKVSDIGRLLVKINVPETDIGYISKSTKAKIISSSLPDSFYEGRIEKYSLTANQNTRSFEVEVALVNSSKTLLRSGMVVEVELNLIEKENTVYFPRDVFVLTGEKPQIYVVDGQNAVLRDIKFGYTSGTIAEVAEGLKAGDKAIVSGMSYLSTGALVKIVE